MTPNAQQSQKPTASTHATHLVHQLIETAATEGGIGPLTDEGREQLLGYLADLESDLAGDSETAAPGEAITLPPRARGAFAVLPREDGLVDVVRLGDVGTQQEQARRLVVEGVGIIAGETAAAVLNGIIEIAGNREVTVTYQSNAFTEETVRDIARLATRRAPATPHPAVT